MELKDTIEIMTSSDYKERFRAEYFQLKIRLEKLSDLLERYAQGTLDFKPACSWNLLIRQRDSMRQYFKLLEQRAAIESIEFKEQ